MQEPYDKYAEVTRKGTIAVLDEFRQMLPRMDRKKILDVGCGTGLLVEHYAKNNDVFGVDANAKSVKTASGKGISARVHDLEKPLPFDSGHFDLVVCKDVLEFIFNSEQLVDEIIRVTKKNGTILMHLPNEFAVPDMLSIFFGRGLLKRRWYAESNELNNPHIRFFTEKGLRQHLEKKGLVVLDYSSRWAFTLPVAKLKFYALSRLSPRLFSPGITMLCTKK